MNLQPSLQSPYSSKAWRDLLHTVFGSAAELFVHPVPVADGAFNGVFVKVLQLGDLKTADGKTAALLDIEVAAGLNLQRNRAGVRHLAARLIDGVTRQAILAVFRSAASPDWRFSFIIRDKTFDLESGQTRSRETPARRFTYLLGPGETCRTAAERFSTLAGTAITLAGIEEAFKVDKLTREFYGELSDWYFWALTRVRFPDDIEKDKDTRNATMTIRLITRLMFVWFLKKKGLIPDCLFDKSAVDEWLTYADVTGSTYYKAVLQNLFFATLNFDPKEGTRGFVEWNKKGTLAYRYKRFFKRGAADRFLAVCKDIPFLNGGLFENLDKDVETAAPRRIDCFSNAAENEKRLAVPDDLFFSHEQTVDLADFYDDKRKSAVKVRGLFEILNAYNFTVEENTPYDKDVALDPELLGQVFENLLASYNPETKTTARKQTGSFYTPREIVHYMVDECLKAYLLDRVGQAFLPADSAKVGQAFPPATLSDRLDTLLSCDYGPLPFSAAEKAAIVQALFTCKILDPACGSGAFPMGILQQMVQILNRLDPDNTYLKTQALLQVKEETNAVVSDSSALDDKMEKMRDTLRLFDETITRPDYARKLLLIENSIYGVDIQPVAVQIAKLRFFISLVVEQSSKDDVRPLPNLETNFVAANTLIGINKPADMLFAADEQVAAIERDLRANRHRHFFARTTRSKLACRANDKRLRDALQKRLVELATKPDATIIADNSARIGKLEEERGQYLSEKWAERKTPEQIDLFGTPKPEQQTFSLRVDLNKEKRDKIASDIRYCQTRIDAEHAKARNNVFTKEAKKLAVWDPYDQNAFSGFFDPEWMFGIDTGFDIVIGNPPFVRADHPSQAEQRQAILASGQYETLWEKWDLFVPFIERSYKLLRPGGVSALIVSDAFCHAKYAQKCQNWLLANSRILRLDFCGDLKIFDAAVHNVIPLLQKADGRDNIPERRLHSETFGNVTLLPSDQQSKLTCRAFFPEDRVSNAFSCATLALDAICYISVGMVIHADEKVAKGQFLTSDLISNTKDKLHPKAFVEGKDLSRWYFPTHSYLEWGTPRAPAMFRRQTFPELYTHTEKLMLPMVGDIRAAYDKDQFLCNHGVFVCLPWHSLSAVRNNSLKKAARYANEQPHRPDLPQREKLEATSRRFAVKYLLGVMNSSAARDFLRANRRNNIQLYPEDWKKLPIPDITLARQQPIVTLVDRILAAKAAAPAADISPLEAEIDRLVSALYGLPAPETAIVEGKPI